MSEEEYNAGVLADVQQAQQIVAAFLEAMSFKGLLHNVRDISACLYITICIVTAQKPGQCQQSTWFQCMAEMSIAEVTFGIVQKVTTMCHTAGTWTALGS